MNGHLVISVGLVDVAVLVFVQNVRRLSLEHAKGLA
jgi:hypothetical protein